MYVFQVGGVVSSFGFQLTILYRQMILELVGIIYKVTFLS